MRKVWMDSRHFTFEEIVGKEINMVPFQEETFFCADDYLGLWEEMRPLINTAFSFDEWTDKTVDEDADDIKIQLTVEGVVCDIKLEKQMGFIDFTFFDQLNEILETLNLSNNRFREVCPEGLGIMSNASHVVFLPREVVEKLDANGYGKWDKKWIGL